MAGQQQAAPCMTSTAVLQTVPRTEAAPIRVVCVDRDGHLFFTQFDRHCVYKVHRRRGRCSLSAVLSGSDRAVGSADGDAAGARFSDPVGLCINPIDPDTLLVMDGRGLVRAVDVVTGAARTLVLSSTGVQPRRLCSRASDGRHHVWVMECEGGDRYRLLRLDMRSLELHPAPLAEGCDIDHVLCADSAGNAICSNWCKPRLWRVRPDGTTTLLAGAAEAGYRDGPATEAQFGGRIWAAAAGDGSVVMSDPNNRRLRLMSPDGTVSTLAGTGEKGVTDGPLAEAQFSDPVHLVMSPAGDVLVIDTEAERRLLRTVPVGLPPPSHWAAPVHPSVAVCSGLLQSGLLADAVIRVAVRGGAAQRQAGGHLEVQGSGGFSVSGAGGIRASASQAGGSADPSSSSNGLGSAAATVDIPCHRNILAAACPYFRALFAGPLAEQQQHAAPYVAPSSSGAAGRKRKAAGAEPTSRTGAGEPPNAAASSSAAPAVAVVMVDGASTDAVHAVLRHVYTGSLDGVTASTAQDVLHLAQQWGLDGLLDACQAYVAEQLLGPGNAAEWLVCAHLRQYGTIRAAALRAVAEHMDAVLGDEAQEVLLKQHPDLLVEAVKLSRRVGGQS